MKAAACETGTIRQLPSGAIVPLLISTLMLLWLPLLTAPALAQQLNQNEYYWYVPDHEKYAHSEFFAEPNFDSARVSVTRTTRFRYLQSRRNWAKLEFDGGTIAFIPLRLLRLAMLNPAASDPWHEFRRASVFSEEPSKIEARLKSPTLEPRAADSKTPVWKRYKERWNVSPRSVSPAASVEGEAGLESPRQTEKKARNPYPLLTPIGPQIDPQRPQEPDTSSSADPSTR